MMKDIAFSSFDDEAGRHENRPLVPNQKGTPIPSRGRIPEDGLELGMVRLSKNHTTISEFATPIFGLVVRVRSLENFSDVESLHENTKSSIEVFRRDLQNEGYDINNLNAASYAICALVDESVMGHQWGAESMWPSETMLSLFHNETWGGDQFFAILDRVMSEAQRYPDLLEFMQMCLLLGFEGKYHVMPNGERKLEELIEKIDEILRAQNPDRERTRFVAPEENVHAATRRWTLPVSRIGIFGILAFVLIAVYAVLAIMLGGHMSTYETELQNQLNYNPKEVQGAN